MAFPTGWLYRKKLTIDSTKVDSTLTDFPVLVKLTSSNFIFSNAKADGTDIRFTASDGTTLLKFERENHDDIAEEAYYWVKIPSISDSVDTDFYIYYGNSLASDGEDPENVWDSNYKAVWHLKELGNGTAGEYIDSTINSHDGQGAGGIPSQIDSVIYKGQQGDGINEYISVPDSDDFYYTGDFTIEWKMRWNTSITNGSIIGQSQGVGVNPKWLIDYGNLASGQMGIHWVNPDTSNSQVTFTWSPNPDTDYHCIWKKSGTTHSFSVNGTQIGSSVDSLVFPNVTTELRIFDNGQGTLFFKGNLDEVRISNGISRSDDFIKASYNSDNNTLLTFNNEESLFPDESDAIQIADSIIVTDTIVQDTDNIIISDSINIQDTQEEIADTIQISDSIIVTPSNIDAKFISKIISINPLIFVTDTDPIEIIKIDTTDPENITWEVRAISGISGAKDVAVNTSNNYIYIAGQEGKVVKVEIADLTNETIIDLSDTDDLLTIETNSNFGLTYVGTENNVGELYVIDERNTFLIDSDFQTLSSQTFLIDSTFQITKRFRIDSDFQVLGLQTFKLDTDFKCLTKPSVPPPVGVNRLDVIDPIKLTDFQVFIDGIELEDTDLILNSINININIGEEQQASFRLSRKHDKLNTTLSGNIVNITNQNTVLIKCKGITIFPFRGEETGKISEIDAQYSDQEFVQINALAPEASFNFTNITMSLPSLNSRLSLYDILIQNPKIVNPFIDPDNEDNPKKFKGIKVDLGQKIKQNNQRFYIFDSNGNIADAIQEGTFNPLPNWTYFWSPTVKKIDNPVLNVTDTTEEEDELIKIDTEEREKPINERKPFLRLATRIRQTLENISNSIQNTLDTISKNIQQLIPLDSIRFLYIGTSLAPVSEDLWDLKQATHWRQVINEDTITGKFSFSNPSPGVIEVIQTDLSTGEEKIPGTILVKHQTFYKIGSAPFKEISVRNGIKETRRRFVDEENGLYSIKDAGYDFRLFAKKVADLEYEKLKNINGDILPDTSCTFNLTIDGYLYYGIALLNRINVDNTTESNIYKNQNGFPVSVKSITITSSDRKVSINADNLKSVKELEEINGEFPNEDDEEYNIPELKNLVALKTNMRTRLTIERTRIENESRLE